MRRRRHLYHCDHCGLPIGKVQPGANGGRVLHVFPRCWSTIEDEGDVRKVRCATCGKLTTWDGEDIRLPKAA